MRIFCPATLFLPHCYWGPGAFRAGMPPLFICLWSTGPRGRVCRPHAHSAAAEIVAIEVGTRCAPSGAGRTPLPGEPGSRQPEQYALDVGPHPNLWPRAIRGILTQE